MITKEQKKAFVERLRMNDECDILFAIMHEDLYSYTSDPSAYQLMGSLYKLFYAEDNE